MINMSTTVEVLQRQQRNLRLNVILGLCRSQLFSGSIVAVDISLVVVLMVQLHDLARNGGLERAVIVC